jgi:hypothetical protein
MENEETLMEVGEESNINENKDYSQEFDKIVFDKTNITRGITLQLLYIRHPELSKNKAAKIKIESESNEILFFD